MATYLYRLGGWAFGHRRTVVLAWVVVVGLVVASAMAFSGRTTDKFEVPGTESQQATDLLNKKFPGAGGGSERMVFAAPAGETLTQADNKAAVEAALAEAKKAPDVSGVIDPYSAHTITSDGRVAYADVFYPIAADELEQSARDGLADTAKPARDAGLQVEWGGTVVKETETSSSESMGMMVGFLVLAITLSSLLAAGLPLITAAIGVITGLTALTAMSGVIDVSETAPTLATMLGLAVGIDYALFILSRHRQNLANGLEPREAAAQAIATAGSAVVFAGLTVIIALVGLLVINIPFLSVMGLAAAGTVAIAVLIAITLLPAILGFAGHSVARINRVLGYRPRRRTAPREIASVRYARFIARRPLPILIVGLVLLCTAALPALHMRLGLPDSGSQPTSKSERRAYDLLTAGFGPGANATLTVVVDAPNLSPERQKQVAGELSSGLQDFPGVAGVSEPQQNKKGDVTIVAVTPEGSPASDETKDLVTHLRDKADEVHAKSGIDAYVTGQTAVNIDTADTLSAALPKYVAVVLALALLLLMVVFRSVLVPIKAAGGFLLSIAASMGEKLLKGLSQAPART